MAKIVNTGKKVKKIEIPKNEIKMIKKRVGADEYKKHVGPQQEYYMKNLDGRLVENRLPLDKVKPSHEVLVHLSEWVHKNLEWRVHEDGEKTSQNANEILELGSGNCNDKAGVLITFMKAVGIPGRFTSIGHSRAEVMLPHNNVEVEFFPSNFMITTREGQWEIGHKSGNPYMHFRMLSEHSLFQFDEHENVFKKEFEEPLNRLLQQKYLETYKKQHTLWTWDKEKMQ